MGAASSCLSKGKRRRSVRPLSDDDYDLDPEPEDKHSLVYLCYKINETPGQERRRKQKERERLKAERKALRQVKKQKEKESCERPQERASCTPGGTQLGYLPGPASRSSTPGSLAPSVSNSSSRRSSICSAASGLKAGSNLHFQSSVSNSSSRRSSICSVTSGSKVGSISNFRHATDESGLSTIKTPQTCNIPPTPGRPVFSLWPSNMKELDPCKQHTLALTPQGKRVPLQATCRSTRSKGSLDSLQSFGDVAKLLQLMGKSAQKLEKQLLIVRTRQLLALWAGLAYNATQAVYELAVDVYHSADVNSQGLLEGLAAKCASDGLHYAFGASSGLGVPFVKHQQYDLTAWLNLVAHSTTLPRRRSSQLARELNRLQCCCGAWMIQQDCMECYEAEGVHCDFSGDLVSSGEVWHCPRGKDVATHPDGQDVAIKNTVKYKQYTKQQKQMFERYNTAAATPPAAKAVPISDSCSVKQKLQLPPLPTQFQPLPHQPLPLPPQISVVRKRRKQERLDALQMTPNMELIMRKVSPRLQVQSEENKTVAANVA